MKLKLIRTAMVLLAAMCGGTATAENYPYRSDMLWVTVPDHADWLYAPGENARVEIQLYKYGIPRDCQVKYELSGDMLPPDRTGTLNLANGRATLDIGTSKTPGFRDCKLTATVDGVPSVHHVKVGFGVDSIRPYTQMPEDFAGFWQSQLDGLAKVPLQYTMREAPQYSTDAFTCSLVKLRVGEKGKSIYGYLFMPRGARTGSCPVVFCPPGAGVKTIKDPLRHRYYAEKGCIRFETEIHGLNPEMSDEEFAEISAALSGGANNYLNNGLDDPDNYYMKNVYLGCVRAIDFLTSLPEWDGRNVAVQGGSQGGALALVTAALHPKVTAAVANHPALSDMAGYLNGTGGYPHFNRQNNMLTPDKVRTMSYYDVVNFARLIKAPVRMTWGYNDNTCPPTTSYAVYNVITAPKEALLTPINEHWTSEATERGHLDWILSKLK